MISSLQHIPGHVGGGGEHVVPVPAGDGDEWHRGGVVAHLLDESGHLLRDLLKPKANICAEDSTKTTIEKKLSKAFQAQGLAAREDTS